MFVAVPSTTRATVGAGWEGTGSGWVAVSPGNVVQGTRHLCSVLPNAPFGDPAPPCALGVQGGLGPGLLLPDSRQAWLMNHSAQKKPPHPPQDSDPSSRSRHSGRSSLGSEFTFEAGSGRLTLFVENKYPLATDAFVKVKKYEYAVELSSAEGQSLWKGSVQF